MSRELHIIAKFGWSAGVVDRNWTQKIRGKNANACLFQCSSSCILLYHKPHPLCLSPLRDVHVLDVCVQWELDMYNQTKFSLI